MLEQLKYKNHINEVFEFGKSGIFVNTNNLHDYEWSVTQKGNRISSLDYSIQKKKLPIIIICETKEKGIEARNKLLEIVEKDVLSTQHGKIIIGDYYLKCFVTKSTKKSYLINKRYMQIELTLTTDFPYWVKESTSGFSASKSGGNGIDYPFDYPFDYGSEMMSNTIFNSNFVPSNFRMVIYGACTNPTIIVSGHAYQVNCTVGAEEYLTIDSTTKKIYLTKVDGKTENKFNDRNKNSYIFQKIPVGENVVTWDGSYKFDIVLMEERSEPKWI